GAGQVVEQQLIVELEQGPELLLQIVLDRLLGLQQLVQRAIQAVLGHGSIGDTQQVFQGRGLVPALRQGEFAARAAKAVDHLDGDDIGGADGFLALGHVAVDDLVKVQELPEPQGEPDVAEAAGIGPADGAQSDPNDVRII